MIGEQPEVIGDVALVFDVALLLITESVRLPAAF
jgi:hypothetical protein